VHVLVGVLISTERFWLQRFAKVICTQTVVMALLIIFTAAI
jgi:hypothetical protein